MRVSALLILGLLAACSHEGVYGDPPQRMMVHVEVQTPAFMARSPVDRDVEVPFGATVLDATQVALPELYQRGHDAAVHSGYLAQIPYVSDNSPVKKGGWTYTVNGEYPPSRPSGMPLLPGDRIVWKYNGP